MPLMRARPPPPATCHAAARQQPLTAPPETTSPGGVREGRKGVAAPRLLRLPRLPRLHRGARARPPAPQPRGRRRRACPRGSGGGGELCLARGPCQPGAAAAPPHAAARRARTALLTSSACSSLARAAEFHTARGRRASAAPLRAPRAPSGVPVRQSLALPTRRDAAAARGRGRGEGGVRRGAHVRVKPGARERAAARAAARGGALPRARVACLGAAGSGGAFAWRWPRPCAASCA